MAKSVRERSPTPGIVSIVVAGYTSIADRRAIDVRPLTILAGTNSSGKSSMMQPLLLLKQTLDATYDPGALLLNGPNVKFTNANQLFSNFLSCPVKKSFSLSVYVELRVGRTVRSRQGGAKDTVSIADVGFGVSQTLPVVVALLTAKPGQLVYIEQPELHLHPRAQVAMAQILCDAANRGVRVVIETHSSLILRGIQTQVARQTISPDLVMLHWFSRSEEDGATDIKSTLLDEDGAFGDWPEDFDDVILGSERAYLDAVEMHSYPYHE